MLKPETIKKCMLDAAKGKFDRKSVQNAFIHIDQTYDKVMSCLTNPLYTPKEDNQKEIIDGAHHKKREIEKPRFCPEQILHHLLIEPIKPIILGSLYEQVYGSLPKTVKTDKNGKVHIKNNGLHAAAKQLKKWTQGKGKLYVCEADIHHAYDSVHIPTLAGMLAKKIKDKKWLRLMYKFLHYDPDPKKGKEHGLILGHYTSPWLFNFYMMEFDHFVAAIPRIKYLRFVDNIFLIGKNKKKLHRAVDMIVKYLKKNLKLELNRSLQVYRFEYENRIVNGKRRLKGRAVNALGFVIHCDRVGLRKGILNGIRRKAAKLKKKEFAETWHDASSMLSRLSWIRGSDTYKYAYRNIFPNINVKRLKSKESAHSKRIAPIIEERRKIIYDGLDKSARLAA